jgi:hypothetical protein
VVTACATNVHKYLLPGYMDALFRVVLLLRLGTSGFAMARVARFCGDGWLLCERACYSQSAAILGGSETARDESGNASRCFATDRNLFCRRVCNAQDVPLLSAALVPS